MSWAARRRFIILLIIGAIAVAFLIVVSIAAFYKTPTCTDGTQNQDEKGIDCGGSCKYLCADGMQSPTVLFTKALKNGDGRVDIVAMVENKNAAAAKNVRYRITLYGADRSFIQEATGSLDLPQGASVPVYVPNIISGKQAVTGAFLEIAEPVQWFSSTIVASDVPLVSNTKIIGTTDAPRIEAVLTNSSVKSFYNVRTVIIVHDEKGEVIAASQTILPEIPAQGQAAAIFTWNNAFVGTAASIKVIPVMPLPER